MNMRKGLEDHAGDVIAKAMRGLGISPLVLAEQTGFDREVVKTTLDGEFDKDFVEKAAGVLKLHAPSLLKLCRTKTVEEPAIPKNLIRIVTPFGEQGVNSYLLVNSKTKKAILIDSGTEGETIIKAIEKSGATLEAVLFTHGHGDHINGWPAVHEKFGVPGYIHPKEGFPGAQSFEEEKSKTLAGFSIKANLTWGHSEAALTYRVDDLEVPLLFTGDSIFARSIGGPRVSYEDALQTIQEHILSAPRDSIILPGHGAITTVANELDQNPFFAR